jgi:hypothetical protein
LKEGLYAKHQILTESSNLGFLGDIIPLTHPYPREQVISIGDVIMNIGIFIFIHRLMMLGKINKTVASNAGKSEINRY